MSRPNLNRIPEWFHNYVNQVPENDLMEAMKKQTPLFISFFESLPAAKRDYRYAEGKWTIKEMLQHIIDAERVFAYRGLCIARQDNIFPYPALMKTIMRIMPKQIKETGMT